MDTTYGYKYKISYYDDTAIRVEVGLVFAYDYKEATAKLQNYFGNDFIEIQIWATSIEDFISLPISKEHILNDLINATDYE